MIGGMISSTILTLIVIPAIYAQVKMRTIPGQAKVAERAMLKLKPAE
jgi:Cu(I)/Ag(I) efflux system membrane protein CusA/SilA